MKPKLTRYYHYSIMQVFAFSRRFLFLSRILNWKKMFPQQKPFHLFWNRGFKLKGAKFEINNALQFNKLASKRQRKFARFHENFATLMNLNTGGPRYMR
jgi:hypothetical protein